MIALDIQPTLMSRPVGWDTACGVVTELVPGLVARWALRYTAFTPAPDGVLQRWHQQQHWAWRDWLNGFHVSAYALTQSIQLRMWRTSLGVHTALVGMTAGDPDEDISTAAQAQAQWAWHMLPATVAVQTLTDVTELQALLNDDWLGSLDHTAIWRVQPAEVWHDTEYQRDPPFSPRHGYRHTLNAVAHSPSPVLVAVTAQPTRLEAFERTDLRQIVRQTPKMQQLLHAQRVWQATVHICAAEAGLVLPAVHVDQLRDLTTPDPVVEQPVADEREAAFAAVQWGQILPWGMTVAPPQALRVRNLTDTHALAASFCPPPLSANQMAALRVPVAGMIETPQPQG